jgi:hypothetical protein
MIDTVVSFVVHFAGSVDAPVEETTLSRICLSFLCELCKIKIGDDEAPSPQPSSPLKVASEGSQVTSNHERTREGVPVSLWCALFATCFAADLAEAINVFGGVPRNVVCSSSFSGGVHGWGAVGGGSSAALWQDLVAIDSMPDEQVISLAQEFALRSSAAGELGGGGASTDDEPAVTRLCRSTAELDTSEPRAWVLLKALVLIAVADGTIVDAAHVTADRANMGIAAAARFRAPGGRVIAPARCKIPSQLSPSSQSLLEDGRRSSTCG